MRLSQYLFYRDTNDCHRWMTLFVLVLGVITLLYGDMVPVNDGLGWDGVMYARITGHLAQMINDGQLNSYYAQRLLPSVIVRALLDLSNLPADNLHIIKIFFLYNWALLIGVSFLWKRIADHFDLSVSGRWLGFAAIFLNFECSKQSFYYPVLTDVTALFVGMLLLLFYVQRRPVALFATAIVGAFAWQVVGLSGAILLLFLNTNLSSESISPSERTPNLASPHARRWMWRAWIVSMTLSIIAALVLFGATEYFTAGLSPRRIKVLSGLGRAATGMPSLLAAILGVALLANSRRFITEVIAGVWRAEKLMIALAFAAILIPWLVVKSISNPLAINPSGIGLVAWLMLLPPFGKILLPIVTNFVFWGPLVMLLLVKWKEFCVVARRLGPGFVFVIMLSLPLCLVTEPRFITSAWPFFVLGGVLVLETVTFKRPFFIAFTVLTFLLAQFWLKMNFSPWVGGADEGIGDYPKQLYFMHYGLWMSWTPYVFQLVLAAASFMWMKKTLRPQER